MPVNELVAARDSIQQPTDGEPIPEETRQTVDALLAEAAEIYDDPTQRPRAKQLLTEAERELQALGGDSDALRHVGKALKGLRR